jgi:hypothetical protein
MAWRDKEVSGEAHRSTVHQVVVTKQALLDILHKNREKHEAAFEQGLMDYRKAVVIELEEQLDRARKGKVIRKYTSLTCPENHTGDYDQVIGMLEMDVNEEISLHESDFATYVLDNWAWMKQFTESTMSNTSYLASHGS